MIATTGPWVPPWRPGLPQRRCVTCSLLTAVPVATDDGDKISVAIDEECSTLVDEADPMKRAYRVELVDGTVVDVRAHGEDAAVLAAGARLGQDVGHLVADVEETTQ